MDGSRLSYLYPANAYPLYLLAEKLHRRYCTFGSYRYVIYQSYSKPLSGFSRAVFCSKMWKNSGFLLQMEAPFDIMKVDIVFS